MSPEVKALMAKAQAALTRGMDIRQKANDEKREMTAEELKNMDAAFTEGRAFKSQAESVTAGDQLKTDLEAVIEKPAFGDIEKKAVSKIITPGQYSDHKSFYRYLAGSESALTPDERKSLVSERKAFGETAEAAGGYLVPEQLLNQIIEVRAQINVLESRVTTLPMMSASMGIPTFTLTMTPAAVAEAGSVSETDGSSAFGKVRMNAGKHSLYLIFDDELEEDSIIALEPFIARKAGEGFANQRENLILNGIGGSANPLGLLLTTFTNTSDISGATDALVPEDLIEAMTDLSPQYRRDSSFIVPNLTLKKIWGFRSMEGGEGTGIFMWIPSLALGQPDTLLGKPLLECAAFADPSSDGDAMFLFGSLNTYYFGQRRGVTAKRLVELLALSGQVGVVFSERYDGTPTDDNAFVRYNRN